MVPVNELNHTLDPINTLIDTIEHVWDAVCDEYDVVSTPPALFELFDNVDLKDPCFAAEMIVANMLTEVIECIGRFSPWYKLPAGEFGLAPQRDTALGMVRWVLCPKAICKWEGHINLLASAICDCGDMIHLLISVDDLIERISAEKSYILVCCDCDPPIIIRIKPINLSESVIVCDICGHPFRPKRGKH